MNLIDRKIRKEAKKDSYCVPKDVSSYVDNVLLTLPEKESTGILFKRYRRTALLGRVALATIIILIFIPNCSSKISYAMENIPVLGKIVRVVTIRNYFYEKGDITLDTQIPQIKVENNGVIANEVNEDIVKWTNQIREKFYEDVDYYGDNARLYTGIDYKVITDDPMWFTLQIQVTETAASSGTSFRYYHINKQSGKLVKISDLFAKKKEFKQVLTEEIKHQMKEEMAQSSMKHYWMEETDTQQGFQGVTEDTNFYISKKGNLIIVFEQFEVAPGYMGCPEFVIAKDVYEDVMKKEFLPMFS